MDELRETAESIEYSPDPARRARLLRLAQMEHASYRAWRSCLFYCGWVSVAVTVCGVPLFGLWRRSESLMWGVFGAAFLLGLFVVCAAFFFEAGGYFTCWTLLRDETLLLEPDAVRYRLRRDGIGRRRGQEPYVWVIPYQNIRRMEYDRSLKRLRVYGLYREEACRFPEPGRIALPRGMQARQPREHRNENDCYIDIPLYYESCEELMGRLERCSGVFIHPAVRGDDFADLRDLPGLKPAVPVVRPMILYLVALCLISALMIRNVRVGQVRNPWQPFPLTAEEDLVRAHAVGDSVLLDGCRVTLQSAEPGQDGGMYVSAVWRNENPDLSVWLHLDRKNTNLRVWAVTGDGEADCAYIPPAERLLQIAPGGEYPLRLLYNVPAGARALVVEFNSDRWAGRKWFWEPEYMGRTVELDGAEYRHNRVRFIIPLE